ncbi:MAG: cytochrome c family protein [Deltaproteobacteria bacterium]|nr:cytochrome c family protein [Deltaproteobacteria bacterium]
MRAARREGRTADAVALQEKLVEFEGRLRALEAERRVAALARKPPPDAHGFTYELVPLERTGPRNDAMAAKLAAYNRRVGEINVAHFASVKLPEPKRGQAVVVNGATCAGCHPDEHAQWLTTAHARAWKTLTTLGKEHDGDCVSCHVTAYMAPLGSKIGATTGLTNVQCEACHGTGSLHAANPKAAGRIACKVTKEKCAPCHTPEHSDRFNFELYTKQTLSGAHGDQPCKN